MNKITVIGDTSSGKTCFLYAMYNFIACGYVSGFTMSAINDVQDEELQAMFEKLDSPSEGLNRFPPPSANKFNYEFSLQYGFKEIASFEWADYPGTYISTQGEGRADLLNDLRWSDAWVIFIDGEKMRDVLLEQDSMKRKRKLMNVCGKYNKFILNLKGEIPTIVSIIVTKSDLLMNNGMMSPQNTFDIIESLIKNDGLSALFADVNDSLKSISLVTLGDRLSENNYSGDLDPVNIEYPITLSMLSILNRKFASVSSQISQLKQKINEDRERLFSSKKRRDSWQSEIDAIRPQLEIWQKMANAILDTLSDDKKIWQNDKVYNFKAFYKQEFLIVE